DKLNIGVNYSNFSDFTNVRTGFEDINSTSPYGHVDTLDFTQISKTFGTMVSYSFGNAEKATHSVNANFNFQEASQKQGDNPEHIGNTFYTGSGGYNIRFKESGFSPGLMMQYSKSVADTITTDMYGPSLTLRQSFLEKKLRTSVMASYNQAQQNKVKQSENTILRASAGYTHNKAHTLNLSAVMAMRKREDAAKSTNEVTVTLTYRYNFNWTPFEKKKGNRKDKTEPIAE
ncbi:MAG: hypothetical protein MI922_28795, partial [Bacteroidales bacterium]|nr:hypothetical protein [Bacteroidales bacterium]